MLINGVKITLIVCLTILVSFVLFISYNEHLRRYAIVPAGDSVYIFDKKSSVLNKCSEKGCEVVETKLPEKVNSGFEQAFLPSKMFGTEKSAAEAVVRAEAVKKQKPNPAEKSAENIEPKSQKAADNNNVPKETPPPQNKQTNPNEKTQPKEEKIKFVE